MKLDRNYQTDIISLWKVEHIIDNHDEYEFDLITTTPLHRECMLWLWRQYFTAHSETCAEESTSLQR